MKVSKEYKKTLKENIDKKKKDSLTELLEYDAKSKQVSSQK